LLANGSTGVPKEPVGVISSKESPARSCSIAKDENAPPGMCLTPIANSPDVAEEQME
jgi:hypothetical protein